jgi:hypothetical protein
MGKRRKGFGDAPGRRWSRAAADLVELRPPPADSLTRSQVTVVCGRNASCGQGQLNCQFSLFPCILPRLYSWPIRASTVPIRQPNWLCLSRYLAYWSQPYGNNARMYPCHDNGCWRGAGEPIRRLSEWSPPSCYTPPVWYFR